jgi:hypothetical protein
MPKPKSVRAVRSKLPIPLTCIPQVVQGKCTHALDSGACELSEQFMCPYWLLYAQQNPDKVGAIPKELMDRVRSTKPIKIPI